MPRDTFLRLAVSFLARFACGWTALYADTTLAEAAALIAEHREDGVYCRLCGEGPFTRRGCYWHFVRKHYDELVELVRWAERRAKMCRRGDYKPIEIFCRVIV